MSIFGEPKAIAKESSPEYTKEMLTEPQQKEASRRFNNIIRTMQDNIVVSNDDVQFIGLLKEMCIRKVYEDSILYKL